MALTKKEKEKRTKEAQERGERMKQAILSQLKTRHIQSEHYISLADDYKSSYIIKQMLEMDVFDRGVVVEYYDSKGQLSKKKNDSVTEIPKIQKQMDAILMSLGIRGSQLVIEDEGGDI